jgi:hypothetical protein
MLALTHGAAVAVRSEEKARPPHPTHPTHPIHPTLKNNPLAQTQSNSNCANGRYGPYGPYDAGCGMATNLFYCDPYTESAVYINNCPHIRKSKIVDPTHPGSD